MIARQAGFRAAERALKTSRCNFSTTTTKWSQPSTSPSKPQNPILRKQNRIPASYYRGGTSRGLIFDCRDLPPSRGEQESIFRGTLGSPDPHSRQLDGLGGGVSSLSKVCVIGPSQREGVDVDFTFAQVGIRDGKVDWSGNCGNLMACVGPWAVDRRVVDCSEQRDGDVSVRVYNTNTDKVVETSFPVHGGEAAVAYGDFGIDGVSGTGARVRLDFLDPAGSKTGKMFPTGRLVDEIDGVRVTCVDVGNPSIFVRADEVGVLGTILPDAWEEDVLKRLEGIRVRAAVKMGMGPAEKVPPSIPKVCILSMPSKHALLSGEMIEEDQVDVVARCISVGQPHKALPITAGLALGAAAEVEGTVVREVVDASRKRVEKGEDLVIGHASGKLDVAARFVGGKGGEKVLERVTVFRTARRLMEGTVFWK